MISQTFNTRTLEKSVTMTVGNYEFTSVECIVMQLAAVKECLA